MKLILHWAIATVAIGIAAYLVPGASITFMGAIVLAVVLAAFNLLIRPILLLLTLPITIVTLGLFTFVINAFLVWLAALIVPGFTVASFWSALFFAVVLVLVNWVFHLWEWQRVVA